MHRNTLLPVNLHRREFLFHSGLGLGSIALGALMAEQQARAGFLASKPPHHAAKAKRCIFLLMEGGPSHIDTFDPKPKLNEIHMTEFTKAQTKLEASMNTGKRFFVRSPFTFQRAGRLGIEVATNYPHFAKVVDDVCFYRGLQAASVNHPTALFHLNCGNQFGGDPAIGSWVAYGLGTENENLPAFVVLPDAAFPQGGAANWSSGYLPAHYQGTPLRSKGAPILDMVPPAEIRPLEQRRNLDLLGQFNRIHQKSNRDNDELAARIESYELAFRMQARMPAVVDFSKESPQTLEMYGVGDSDGELDAVARRCLLARRLVEAGVRFVQVIVGGWDSHDDIERAHSNRIRVTDKPIAALIKDLKRTGLIEDTLVVWAGEFGRSPDNGIRQNRKTWGRDHNAKAMPVWLAGGGAPRGRIVGATDELGQTAVEDVHPLRDFHVTLLHLLGLNDAKLTYFHAGRNKQLSQTGGELIRKLIA